MFLESSEFRGEGENIYKPHKMILMHDQKVVIRLNFRADTITYVEGWKKKSKKHTLSSNLTSESDSLKISSASRRSLVSHESRSNEVEVYFPAGRIKMYVDFHSNSKGDDEPYNWSDTIPSIEERGR